MKITQIFRQELEQRGDANIHPQLPLDFADWLWLKGADLWGTSINEDGYANYTQQTGSDALSGEKVIVLRFRNDFTSDGTPLRFDVTADERFVLYIDGQPFARGPHRGMVNHWYYESYEISELTPGTHRMEAVCWQLGWHSPMAQLSWRGGFILAAEGTYDAQLTTGKGNWNVAPLNNITMGSIGTSRTFGVGTEAYVQGTGYHNAEPAANDWQVPAVVRRKVQDNNEGLRERGWILYPTQRPDQMAQPATPGKVVNAPVDLTQPFQVPANTTLELYWDLDNYYCAYPEIAVSGGKDAVITWGWAESLWQEKKPEDKIDDEWHPWLGEMEKGNRREWKGKEFSRMLKDTFVCDGRDDALFTTPWWRSGRWCKITIKTAAQPLTVRKTQIVETRYPLSCDGGFTCSDKAVDDISRISLRTLQMCMHDMMFDCPHYEQQMYPGDTRIQLGILNTLTRDDRMQRFVMSIFDNNRRDNGMVAMNFPSRNSQESSTYTLCWILMFQDYLMWHDNLPFLRNHAPGVRAALMSFALYENTDNLVQDLPGWSFMDWVTDRFQHGVAPDGDFGQGVSACNNLLYLLALQAAEKLDTALGEKHFAAQWHDKAQALAQSIVKTFWDENRGMIADTVRHDEFSEHAQCLAILTDCLTPSQAKACLNGLLTAPDLAPVSSYFAYYKFEALTKAGRADLVMKYLDAWKNFVAWGADTAFETQHTNSRSDCHAWSASPLYFFPTAIAGITPAAPCFKKVRIAPCPAGLTQITAKVPCPQGIIDLAIDVNGNAVSGTVTLPNGLDGTFEWQGKTIAIPQGTTTINL